MKQYGISSFEDVSKNDLDIHLESIKRTGITIFKNILSEKECNTYSNLLESVYKTQENSFGVENLSKINELDIARMPFAYNDSFLKLILKKEPIELVKKILGENFILQLQNGVINRNKKEHHQSSWHRDIPYQEYTTSKPISLNVFFCLSPFNSKTGGTIFLPYSHLFANAPSLDFFSNNMIQPNLNSGDVIVFDSWVYHKAGFNSSEIIRYGLNQVFTSPILKQQINIPRMLKGKHREDNYLNEILGYSFDPTENVDEYRENKLNKLIINKK